MRISDLAYGIVKTVEVQRLRSEPFPPGGLSKGTEITLQRSDRWEGALLQLPDTTTFRIEGVASRDQRVLADTLIENAQSLFWIAASEPKQAPRRLVIQAHQFPTRFQWPQITDLGVGERIVEQAQRQYWRHARATEQVVQRITDQLLLPGKTPDHNPRMFVSAGPEPAPNETRGYLKTGTLVDFV